MSPIARNEIARLRKLADLAFQHAAQHAEAPNAADLWETYNWHQCELDAALDETAQAPEQLSRPLTTVRVPIDNPTTHTDELEFA